LLFERKIVSHQHSKQKANTPRRSADPFPDESAVARARKKLKKLWQLGDLFHITDRYPRKAKGPRIDRLAGILTRGLLAPAQCSEGLVRSDLNIVVTGCGVSYDSLVFLHRFGEVSYIYTFCEPDRFAVFIDPAVPVLTPEAMGAHWPMLCMDEVYVRHRIAVEKLIGVAVHPADSESVKVELIDEFRRLGIPLYDYGGNVLWPPA
jgi:hypothetical protein